MYVDFVISNVFNLNKHFFFSLCITLVDALLYTQLSLMLNSLLSLQLSLMLSSMRNSH